MLIAECSLIDKLLFYFLFYYSFILPVTLRFTKSEVLFRIVAYLNHLPLIWQLYRKQLLQ